MAQLLNRTGANPAAGSQVTDTVPVGEVWKLYGARLQLVTSATVATRTLTLSIDDGTNVWWTKTVVPTQAAGLTRQYLFLGGLAADDAAFDAGGNGKFQLPSIVMPAGWRIVSSLASGQVGDDFAAPIYYVAVLNQSDRFEVNI